MAADYTDLQRALAGLPKLFVFDAGFAGHFGRDRRACIRSFLAYLMASPAMALMLVTSVYAIVELARREPISLALDPGDVALVHVLGTILEIVGFPVLVRPLLRTFGRLDRWFGLVAVTNWLGAAQVPLTIVAALLAAHLGPVAPFALMAVQIYFLVVEAFATQVILEVGAKRALGVVLVDFGFGCLVQLAMTWIDVGSLSLG